MIPNSLLPLANHLWQSTLFTGAAALLALALRKSPARVRHGIWLAASLKFLVPFSLLVALGSQVHWRSVPAPALPTISTVMNQVNEPFTNPEVVDSAPRAAQPPASPILVILVGVWTIGFTGIACSWWI